MQQGKDSEKIIVSMTSWKKRINNVPYVIESILNNSILPDKIVVNLSIEEFPEKESSLPEKVVKLQRDGTIEIGWQEGNTKAFKKIIPTMEKYPNDVIIGIDDDFIYPVDFIESFIEMHRKYPNNPLSGNKVAIFGVKAHCGCASLVKRVFFGEYLNTIIDEHVISIGSDDAFYTICASLCGYKYMYIGKEFFNNMVTINPVDGISSVIGGKAVYTMHDYLLESIRKKYNINSNNWAELIFANPCSKNGKFVEK